MTPTRSRSGCGGATTTSALFEGAAPDQVRGESTPFYLWSRGAHRRIGEALPEVKVIAVVRDPIDRAYSNWMHLWSDGLEPESDFETAFALQDARVAAGWAPFWRYRDLGLYGDQLAHLRRYVDPERILVIRYREIIDQPQATVDAACRFLGIDEGHVPGDPPPQLAQLRRARLAAHAAGPGRPRRRPARRLRAAAGLAQGQRAAGQPAERPR